MSGRAPFHPHRNISSLAKISPMPAITPVMNGSTMYMAVNRNTLLHAGTLTVCHHFFGVSTGCLKLFLYPPCCGSNRSGDSSCRCVAAM
ncbi:hypothetical protein FBU59_003349 [Linderina macrospora]|uniref:Uncharacterized protein n=1 Tax=Linderina macrospora TaxID=4868 RepID=A0ACC1J8R9_9FUNG|nr:hypothetical protein FBU59_003349 [Linderina macrospora]